MKYQLIDTKTGLLVAEYKDGSRARRTADKLDMQYGAVRYVVRILFAS